MGFAVVALTSGFLFLPYGSVCVLIPGPDTWRRVSRSSQGSMETVVSFVSSVALWLRIFCSCCPGWDPQEGASLSHLKV